jgi:hypothetical protein
MLKRLICIATAGNKAAKHGEFKACGRWGGGVPGCFCLVSKRSAANWAGLVSGPEFEGKATNMKWQ